MAAPWRPPDRKSPLSLGHLRGDAVARGLDRTRMGSAGAARHRHRAGTRPDLHRRLGTLPAPLLRVRGDARLRCQDWVRAARPFRPRACRLRRDAADADAPARFLPRRNREPAGRGRDVLLLHALPDADPGWIRLLASQPRSLPPLHRRTLADGLLVIRDVPLLAVGPALVPVPGRTGRELTGRAQDPQRDGGQVLGIELLRFSALLAPEPKPVRGVSFAPRSVPGAGRGLRLEQVPRASHRTLHLDRRCAFVYRVSRRAL